MSEHQIIVIIQARMGSSRLPGKVLLDIAGEPMLARVVTRAARATTANQIVIATTTEPDDDPVVEFCQARGISFQRGSLHDVLDRYYQTASAHNADIIVRITADCPLIDPALIDKTVLAFLGDTTPNDQRLGKAAENGISPYPFDFTANRLPPPWGRTYPIGLDTEVCSIQALQAAWKEAVRPYQREHVMPFLYEERERFRCLLVNHSEDFGTLRWTVDTPEDLELIRQVFARFPGRDDFSWLEVLDLFQREPELAQINAQVRHKIYDEVDTRR